MSQSTWRRWLNRLLQHARCRSHRADRKTYRPTHDTLEDTLDTLTDPTNPFGDLYVKTPDGGFNQPFNFFGGYNPDVYNLTTTDGTRYKCGEFKGLQQITDASGNTVTFTDAGITSSERPAIIFKRDARGRIAEIDDPAGNPLTYTFDARGNLMSTTDALGHTLTAVFTSGNQVQSSTDALGHTVTLLYDANNRPTGFINAAGATSHISRDSMGRITITIDNGGHTMSFAYARPVSSLSRVAGAAVARSAGICDTRYTYDASAAGHEIGPLGCCPPPIFPFAFYRPPAACPG
jgi:YD repeat-containing protein